MNHVDVLQLLCFNIIDMNFVVVVCRIALNTDANIDFNKNLNSSTYTQCTL